MFTQERVAETAERRTIRVRLEPVVGTLEQDAIVFYCESLRGFRGEHDENDRTALRL